MNTPLAVGKQRMPAHNLRCPPAKPLGKLDESFDQKEMKTIEQGASASYVMDELDRAQVRFCEK